MWKNEITQQTACGIVIIIIIKYASEYKSTKSHKRKHLTLSLPCMLRRHSENDQ